MTKERQPRHHQGEAVTRSSLPEPLADFLKNQRLACLMHGTDHGTVFVVKAPYPEIESVRGRVPIHFRHELYDHPLAPVVRTIVRIYDQPQNHLALETFTNIEDEQQRSEFAALAKQDSVLMLFYDEGLQHRLTKQVSYGQNRMIPQILKSADELLAVVPREAFDFDRAKRAVMERTSL